MDGGGGGEEAGVGFKKLIWRNNDKSLETHNRLIVRKIHLMHLSNELKIYEIKV